MIEKIYRKDSEGYTYAKNYKSSWDSTSRVSFGSSLSNAADSFNLSDKTKMQNSYSDFLNTIGADVNAENMQAVKSVESRLQYFTNTNAENVTSMSQLGIDPGKVDDMTIYKEVQDQKEDKADDDDTISMSVWEYGEKHPEIYNDIRLFKIAKALFANGMVVSDYNVDKLVSVGDMLSKIGTFNNDDIVNFFKGDSKASAENICFAKHTGANNNDVKLSKSQVDQLVPEIDKLFEREGIEKTDENIETARLFVENDIPVTKENVEKADFLKNTDFSDIYDSLAKLEASGRDCAKADLIEVRKVPDEVRKRLYENYIKVSDNIKNIDIEVLRKMYENGTEYTLKNISDTAQNYVSENINLNIRDNSAEMAAAVTAKRKITEIQLRMTNEAMVRLSGKGIDITTAHIEDALETLKQEEKEINSGILSVVGAEVNEENLKVLAQAMDVKSILPNIAAMSIFENAIKSKAAISFNFNYIASTIESLELAPSAKYGDTLPYNDEQLANLLKTNGFDVTEENKKAAEIISRNEITLNAENLLAVKTVNLKLDKVYNKLHPLTAAQMIKDGINPLEVSLDDMLEYIDNYNQNKGQTSKEKIAEYIIEAENSGELSQQEKKAVTAIYRALNMAESYKSAAVGLSIESGSTITLGDLLGAARAFSKAKKVGFDNKIDDNFGLLEELRTDEESIQSTVMNAVDQLNETDKAAEEYINLLIERLIDVSAPDELVEYMRQNGTLNNELLEDMYQGLKVLSAERNDLFISREKTENLAEKIRTMNNGGKDAIKWLTENNIPLTVNNISSMAKLMADSFKSGRELNRTDKSEKTSGRNGIGTKKANELNLSDETVFSEISEEISDELEDVYEDIIISEQTGDIGGMLARLSELGLDIDLQKSFNSKDGGAYQIPVRLSDGNITNLNVYTLNNNFGNDGVFKGFMNIETTNTGTVGAYITVKNADISVRVKTNSNVNLSDYGNELNDLLREVGFENISIEFYSDNSVENVFSADFEEKVEANAPDLSDINVLI